MKKLFLTLFSLILLASYGFAAEQQYANEAVADLAGDITNIATTVTIDDATGWPTANGTDWFMATLIQADGDMEIIKVTTRSGTTLTVLRAQEGTTGLSCTASPTTIVACRLTAETLDRFEADLEKVAGTDAGDIVTIDGTQTLTNKTITAPVVTTGTFASPALTTPTVAQINAAGAAGVKIYDDGGTKGLLVDDDGHMTLAVQPSCKLYVSSGQAIADGVVEDMDFGANSHNIGSHGSQASDNFTVPTTGLYLIIAQAKFGVTADGDRLSLRIKVNGTSVATKGKDAVGTGNQTISQSTTEYLTAADVIATEVLNDDNDDSVQSGVSASFMCVTMLH